MLQPDYCGKVVTDSILRWVDVKTRVRTMAALGHSNFQKKNTDVDKLCDELRRLDDLSKSVLKESVQMGPKEHSSESKSESYLSKSDENDIDYNFETQKDIQPLSKFEILSIESQNARKVNATSINDRQEEAQSSGRNYTMRGSENKGMLGELYALFMARDDIDGKMHALMEALIKANVMNRNRYDEEAMDETIREIIETRRLDREIMVRVAEMEKLHDTLINRPTKIDDELESVQTREKTA